MPDLTNPIKVIVIGIMELNDGEKELRFRRDDNGDWIADLIVDNVNETVGAPPECFTPTEEVVEKLDAVLLKFIVGAIPGLLGESGD